MDELILKYIEEEKKIHPYNFPVDLSEESLKNFLSENFGYFEAIIDVDGKVYEAKPSHTEGLIRIAATKKGLSRDEFYNTCPESYYFDMIAWGIHESGGAIPVWQEFHNGNPNSKQVVSLRKLKKAGLYMGPANLNQ